jgi:hypothetical protein
VAKKDYGKTKSGVPIDDELVEKLAAEAEAGYPVSVESLRLDPELGEALRQRAERDHETASSVIRKALREYLQLR